MEAKDIFKNIKGLTPNLEQSISGEFNFYLGKDKNNEDNCIIEVNGSAYYNCQKPEAKTNCHRYYLELEITNVKGDKTFIKSNNTLVVLMLNPSNTFPAMDNEKAKVDGTVKNAVRVAYKAGYSKVIILNTFSYIDGNSLTAINSIEAAPKDINITIIKKILEKHKDLLIAWGGKVRKEDKENILSKIYTITELKIYAYAWSDKSNNPYHLSNRVNNKKTGFPLTKFLTDQTGEKKLIPLKITNQNDKYFLELVSQNSQ